MLEDIARGNGTKFPEKVDLSSGKKDGGKVGEVETLACLFSQPALYMATLIQFFSWYATYPLTLSIHPYKVRQLCCLLWVDPCRWKLWGRTLSSHCT